MIHFPSASDVKKDTYNISTERQQSDLEKFLAKDVLPAIEYAKSNCRYSCDIAVPENINREKLKDFLENKSFRVKIEKLHDKKMEINTGWEAFYTNLNLNWG